MKIKFWNNNNANIHSEKTEVFDTERDFQLSDEEWLELGEETQREYVKDWAFEWFEWGWEEV